MLWCTGVIEPRKALWRSGSCRVVSRSMWWQEKRAAIGLRSLSAPCFGQRHGSTLRDGCDHQMCAQISTRHLFQKRSERRVFYPKMPHPHIFLTFSPNKWVKHSFCDRCNPEHVDAGRPGDGSFSWPPIGAFEATPGWEGRNLCCFLSWTYLLRLVGYRLSHYLQGFIHPRWCVGFLPSTVFVKVCCHPEAAPFRICASWFFPQLSWWSMYLVGGSTTNWT